MQQFVTYTKEDVSAHFAVKTPLLVAVNNTGLSPILSKKNRSALHPYWTQGSKPMQHLLHIRKRCISSFCRQSKQSPLDSQ
jgi:hypothetical protein